MKKNIKDMFSMFKQQEIIEQMNLIQGYIKESRAYFLEFERYLNDVSLSDTDKLICIKNNYLEFCSHHIKIMGKDNG